jgi:hypothetical protein
VSRWAIRRGQVVGGDPLGQVRLGMQVGGAVGRRVLEMMGEGRSCGEIQVGGGGDGEGGEACMRVEKL